MPSSRVDYDAIAELYDTQPYREKSADPELATFLAARRTSNNLALLDIACGTGNQLVANRAIASGCRMVGIDGSFGMLRQAKPKSPDIGWVLGDAAMLPFAPQSFDFVSCQYAFHHFHDKAGMIREALRALRVGGRLVIYNLCPQESPDWLYYDYFPEAQDRDLADFWPPEAIVAEMAAACFADISAERRHIHFDHDLRDLRSEVLRRDTNSQVLTLSDAAYEAGLRRIERDIDGPDASHVRADHLCFVTVRGDKPAPSPDRHRGGNDDASHSLS
jgi:ubiquinone/menaquinone biosynthesis C-methylase UbiE